jgi:hypothetical protein
MSRIIATGTNRLFIPADEGVSCSALPMRPGDCADVVSILMASTPWT